ncbi:MAG: beta-hexosaminidase [Sphingobacteriales bacterium]|nr:MAG: beta-hexosaminidase [Sphingobacteriales bacterium]
MTTGSDDSAWLIPVVHIEDSPKFQWRGMHLDVSRHFYSISYLEKFIDLLAFYKFNTFHLHLTDDQGWRLEIKKYPKLTETGAWRELNDQDLSCLEMAKTNPDFDLPKEFLKTVNGKTLYGGSYTQDEMAGLIRYAQARKITIVPEIDMPGHMMAAIRSYPGLTCKAEDGWGKTFSTPLCPCNEQVYTFVEDVLTEIVKLFPSKYIHIGADEVEKTTWESSENCKDLMKKEGIKDVNGLQSYFVKRIEKFLNSKGRKMIGWDEVLEGGVDSSTTVMYWRGWEKEAPKKAARAGNKVIMSPTDYSYFDYQQDERTLEKLYNAKVIPDGLTDLEQQNIIGVQGNIWTEYIPSIARLEYMIFPRVLAMAELGWATERDHKDFDKRLQWQYGLLEKRGINFRMPDIGNIKERMVFTDVSSLQITKPPIIHSLRYTTDGSAPGINSSEYVKQLEINQAQTIKIAGFTRSGRRGDVSTIVFDKQTYLTPELKIEAVKPGVSAEYFPGAFKSLKAIPKSGMGKQEFLNELDVPKKYVHPSGFAVLYSGYINVPEKGIYTFYLNADDGASLTIGDRLVIDNDGPHAPKEKNGQIALDAGLHFFKLPFFEAGGGYTLELKWEGPGIIKSSINGSLYIKK